MIKNESMYKQLEWYIFVSCFVFFLTVLIIDQISPSTYDQVLSQEDGPLESLTAVFLLLAGGLCWQRAQGLEKTPQYGHIVFACFLLFVAGEELSWGQRIFHFSTPKIFDQYNAQHEFNLHNLKFHGVKVNRVIFGNLFEFCVLTFLVVSPLLYRENIEFQKWFDQYSIPCPEGRLVVGYIMSLQLILFMDSERKWEAMELLQSITCVLLILTPVVIPKNHTLKAK